MPLTRLPKLTVDQICRIAPEDAPFNEAIRAAALAVDRARQQIDAAKAELHAAKADLHRAKADLREAQAAHDRFDAARRAAHEKFF